MNFTATRLTLVAVVTISRPLQTYSLFVYGTLRKGGIYHGYLRSAKLLQQHYLLKGYSLYDSLQQYPYMLKGGVEDTVVGEVYGVGEELLQQLHILEDIGNEYRFVYLPEHRFHTYLKFDNTVQDLPLVSEGDWIRYIRQKENRK